MSINKVILVGNVGKDPEVRFFDNNVSKASFSLATSERYKNKSGEIVTNTEWHNIVAWRGLAQTIEKYVKKGSLLYVEGKITYRTFDGTDGQKKYFTEILADSIKMLNRIDDGTRSSNQESKEDFANESSERPENANSTTNKDFAGSGEINKLDNGPEETDDLPF